MTRSVLFAFFTLAGLTAASSAQEKLPDAPLPAREAAARMTVPDGFKVTLFAGEPDVVQPIAFTFDDRGRLWVVEGMSYPKWNKDTATEKGVGGRVLDNRKGKDRIVILEDSDGDGQFDKRTVFADNLTNLSGIEYGFGGIWLCSIPNLIYVPIKPGEDKPAGPPEIKLDGWSMQSGHNAFNSLKWGPDGWLYGCNGILANSRLGAPGTPDKDRTPMNCGVWRYHPTKKKFEVFATGTTNPWGLDWDEYGEMFITNCVIDHVWHVVPGGHYERMYGQDFNPHLYKLMPSIADHKHWAGGSWTESRGGKGAHSDAGGGHAHVGCMIYQGDNWPAKYRNTLFTLNLHGNRINNDILERKGSTYVAKHGKDFLFANDPWFRGITIDYGPDGGVYVSDWCDTGECHNYQVAHTTTGRIYKVTYGKTDFKHVDMAKLTNEQLLQTHFTSNEWQVRHARRLLHERAQSGELTQEAAKSWLGKKMWKSRPGTSQPEHVASLRRILMTLNATGNLTTATAFEALLGWENLEEVRGADSVLDWTIERLYEPERMANWYRSPYDKKFMLKLARSTPHGFGSFVRNLQHLPLNERWHLADALFGNSNKIPDVQTTLLLWYGIEPLAEADPEKAIKLIAKANEPVVREFMARRVAGRGDEALNRVVEVAGGVTDPSVQEDLLRGIQESLKGRRSHPQPAGWDKSFGKLMKSKNLDVRQRALALAVVFGDERALHALGELVVDATAQASSRQKALQTLAATQSPSLVGIFHKLLDESSMRSAAIQGLAAYADPKTPSLILERYAKFTSDEKSDAVHTLASRPAYALALLDGVAAKTVARTDLNAFTVRQLLALNDKRVTARVNEVWGTLRPASQEKAALMVKYKKLLTPETLKQANLSNGRLVYAKNCVACHKLFGEGGNIGPELTGSQRANLEYVLENMLDPSAVVPREYQVSILTTASGRTLTGIVKEETERTVTVQTQNEVIILPKDEIEFRKQSPLSMMPEGVLDRMTIEEIRDLVAYLASPMQTPLLKQP